MLMARDESKREDDSGQARQNINGTIALRIVQFRLLERFRRSKDERGSGS
jgi:hypothetical protein